MSLTDEELSRYGQIAMDQYRREARLWWAQGLVSLAAVGWAVWAIHGLVTERCERLALLMLGLSAVLGYWPYRKAKSRRLWWGHYVAVTQEQGRRLAYRGGRETEG